MRQIILMTHASSVVYKRIKNQSDASSGKQKDSFSSDKIIIRGKSLDKLNSEELERYYSNFEGFGPVTQV